MITFAPLNLKTMTKYIPSLLTLSNLFCGFIGIVLADMYWSPILLLLCFFFDSLDGAAARYFNATSDFGKELDSLADIVSFGVFPAVMYYHIAPFDIGSIWPMITCGLIVAAGATRLAKFNIAESKPYFSGLPIPANALFYSGIIMSIQYGNDIFNPLYSSPSLYVMVSLFISLMMVSFNLRMFTTKGLSKMHKENIYHYLMFAFSIVCIVIFKFDALPVLLCFYIILSIINTLTAKELSK